MGINKNIRENSTELKTGKAVLEVVKYEHLLLNRKLLQRIKNNIIIQNWEMKHDELVINYENGTIILPCLSQFVSEEFDVPVGDLNVDL